MATPTVSDIKAILDAGVYPSKTISPGSIFDFLRPRKRYPSIEVEMVKPEGFVETKETTKNSYTYQIHVYYKQLGLGSNEMVTIRTIEDQIVILLSAATLGDHKVTNESFSWERKQIDKNHPYFYRSTLTLAISRITSTTATPDGVLRFDLAGSAVDSPPGADYTYFNVYDVEITEGYRDKEEMVTSNPDGLHLPVHYAGGFTGRFIAHFHVVADDIGATGDKLNQLKAIRANGTKPQATMIYTQKDSQSPSPATITETVVIQIDELNRMYSHADLVRWRLLAKPVKPTVITAI